MTFVSKELTKAEVARLKRMPNKLCPRCRRFLPNTGSYFPLNEAGRMMRSCLECKATRQVTTKAKQTCPLCRQLRRLVRDRANHTETVFMCRPCLILVNNIVGATPDTLIKAINYAAARNKKQAPLQSAGPGHQHT